MPEMIYVEPETFEIERLTVQDTAVEAAQAMVEEIWRETASRYNVAPLTALGIAHKITNAVLSGAVKEAVDILAEPLRPKQPKLPGFAHD